MPSITPDLRIAGPRSPAILAGPGGRRSAGLLCGRAGIGGSGISSAGSRLAASLTGAPAGPERSGHTRSKPSFGGSGCGAGRGIGCSARGAISAGASGRPGDPDLGAKELGSKDLGSKDLGSVLGSKDLGSKDLGSVLGSKAGSEAGGIIE